jgi:hypothetical protein
MSHSLPRYPIFIPSKNRSHIDMTTKFFRRDGVPFYLVVEPQDFEIYQAKFGSERLLMLPDNDRGLIFARNWIKRWATAQGFERHWQIDDNIYSIQRRYKSKRIDCHSGTALAACEDFVDRYSNVAIAGLNYTMFAYGNYLQGLPPFQINQHVYSCTLILNSIPNEFRPPANEDVDMCLQVLADGWCTILFNAFLARKIKTMVVAGGQTDAAYHGDGRLFMARALERVWPYVVTTGRRFQRPQHVVRDQWRRFDTPLKLRDDIDLSKMTPDEYGLELVAKKEIKSDKIRRLVHAHRAEKK